MLVTERSSEIPERIKHLTWIFTDAEPMFRNNIISLYFVFLAER